MPYTPLDLWQESIGPPSCLVVILGQSGSPNVHVGDVPEVLHTLLMAITPSFPLVPVLNQIVGEK